MNVSGMAQNMCVDGQMVEFRQGAANLWPNYCHSGGIQHSHNIAARWMVSNVTDMNMAFGSSQVYNHRRLVSYED